MTSAPSPVQDIQQKTLHLLGWDLVRKSLANRAVSPLTQEQFHNLLPEETLAQAKHLLDETEAMKGLLDGGDVLPLRSFESMDDVLRNIQEHALIESTQGLRALNLLNQVRDLKRMLTARETLGILRPIADLLDPLPALRAELDRCIDSDGEIKEDATPELKQAHRDWLTAKNHLETSVKKLMGSANVKDALQDAYFTEREGRVVLPVRADHKGKVEGIVHDSSGSGQTFFIEPTSIVPLNNQIKIAFLKIEQEKIRVLTELARALGEHQAILQSNIEQLVLIDNIHARARLAKDTDSNRSALEEKGPVSLIEARNPELVLTNRHVVANSIELDASTQVLVISGPNTGGKTVTLKTLGLMALMARAGLFLPTAPHSKLCFFPEVYADIGDDQNLAGDLSTFSGHLTKIIHILKFAQAGSLVLLDELGIATDPQEGSALAEAILLEMKQRGLTTLVSTHYLGLKILAQTETGFQNACMEFDMESMRPSYRLIFGVPGNSAALETAERLGLPDETLSRARSIYHEKDRRAETLLDDLTRQKNQLQKEMDSIKQSQMEIESMKKEQEEATHRLKEKERSFQKTRAQKMQAALREAKREIRQLIQKARKSGSTGTANQISQKLHTMEQNARVAASDKRQRYTRPASQLKVGDEVMVEGYEAFGILEENPDGRDKVRVRLGNLTTLMETSRLHGRTDGRRTLPVPEKNPTVKIQAEGVSQAKSQCDLRGMRVEEARDCLELFLSQAVMNKLPSVRVVHGHGMGKIKQMVRDYLASAGIGKEFTPGAREEGGDGVTVVKFQ